MFDEKQKSYVKLIQLVTDGGVSNIKAFYKVIINILRFLFGLYFSIF